MLMVKKPVLTTLQRQSHLVEQAFKILLLRIFNGMLGLLIKHLRQLILQQLMDILLTFKRPLQLRLVTILKILNRLLSTMQMIRQFWLTTLMMILNRRSRPIQLLARLLKLVTTPPRSHSISTKVSTMMLSVTILMVTL